MFSKLFLLGLISGALVSLPLNGRDPGWWTDNTAGTRIIESGSTPNHYGPANLGQVKHVAAMAREYLEQRLVRVGGAGPGIASLVDGFELIGNFVPLNLGQLKYVTEHFYSRFSSLRLTVFLSDSTQISPTYPTWLSGGTSGSNFSPANLGQLKHVFSWELTNAVLSIDSDADGIPDYWEYNYGTLSDFGDGLGSDFDGDGLSDEMEYAFNSIPNATTPTFSPGSDSDGDGVNDEEDAAPWDPAISELSIQIQYPGVGYVIE